MNECPFHRPVRPGLPELTPRIAKLPRDERGYPVPFFVAWIDGKPEFRLSDPEKWALCHNFRRCWTCGEELGRFVTFAIGPMCSVNRVTSEPPSHLDCAQWAVKGCPFMSKPSMTRRGGEIIEANKGEVAGTMIERNAGVTALWTSAIGRNHVRGYDVFLDPQGRPLIDLIEPTSVTWWREGRVATRAEVLESIHSGLPLLKAACMTAPLAHQQDEQLKALDEYYQRAMQYIPAETKSLIITP